LIVYDELWVLDLLLQFFIRYADILVSDNQITNTDDEGRRPSGISGKMIDE